MGVSNMCQDSQDQGAHFFKVHGRVAAYRLVTTGTKCEACQTEFWSEGRLAAHMLSSPGCVSHLRQLGSYVETICPGFGSKKRRKAESTAYTLSVPQRHGQIPPVPAEADWSPESCFVYRELCDVLHGLDPTVGASELCDLIRDALRLRPLFPDEVLMILDRVAAEVRELTEDGLDDPWNVPTAQLILESVESVKSGLWTITVDCHSHLLYHSLREFQSILADFDWAGHLNHLHPADGTPSTFVYYALPDWEAEWRQSISKLEVSAVVDDVGLFLPSVLRRAWQSLLSGSTVVIHAPSDLWCSTLAAPFHLCKPN